MASSTSRVPYRGSRRKLVLAFDVGTTYSGVSYSILDPGQVPEIKGVTRFPRHETISGGSKIPTIIYYDRSGKVQAVGAEAKAELVYEIAQDNEWIKAEWFKLHLRSGLGARNSLKDIPPLPLNKSATDVFADFMRYLLQCSASYIQDTHANGAELWRSVKDKIDFVLSHPNGWEGNEQSQMRQAAVLAGLIPDNAEGHSRLTFVTEGEASLHFSIHNSLPSGAMSNGDGVVIVDAGGGTIDISMYAQKTISTTQIVNMPPTVSDGSAMYQTPVTATALRGHYTTIFKEFWAQLRGKIHGRRSHKPLEEQHEPADVDSPKASNSDVNKYDIDEIAAPQCLFQGSVFVTIRARLFLEHYLGTSLWSEYLDEITDAFDKSTKLRFRDSAESQYIRFGSTRDNDPTYNIRFGQLKLQGSDVAMFFQPSVDSINSIILEQAKVSYKPISCVVLVGGFASSDWLLKGVKSGVEPHGLNIFRPEKHVNKAVADGAVSFYLDHFVRSRVAKLTYGYFCHIPFNRHALDHQQRAKKAFISMGGEKRINDAFDIILPKNTQVSETREFRRSYFRESTLKKEFDSASFSVWCYRGALPEPKWKDVDTDGYTELCTIKVDLSHLPLQSQPKSSGWGRYYRLDYDIILLFGLTELKAHVSWKENGLEKRSPARIVYEPDRRM